MANEKFEPKVFPAGTSLQIKNRPPYRAIQFSAHWVDGSFWNYLQILWGLDCWMGNIPVLKTLVACNIAVWILLFVVGK